MMLATTNISEAPLFTLVKVIEQAQSRPASSLGILQPVSARSPMKDMTPEAIVSCRPARVGVTYQRPPMNEQFIRSHAYL